jgi:hypothetical protein
MDRTGPLHIWADLGVGLIRIHVIYMHQVNHISADLNAVPRTLYMEGSVDPE